MARLSRHDQAHRLTVKRLGRVDSHYVSPSRVSSALRHTGRTPLISILKPIFQRDKYEEIHVIYD